FENLVFCTLGALVKSKKRSVDHPLNHCPHHSRLNSSKKHSVFAQTAAFSPHWTRPTPSPDSKFTCDTQELLEQNHLKMQTEY
ncbi:hypothetical protein BpHYR1_031352, partial [Brachionus plicatilis]